jgi:hypothetical protein
MLHKFLEEAVTVGPLRTHNLEVIKPFMPTAIQSVNRRLEIAEGDLVFSLNRLVNLVLLLLFMGNRSMRSRLWILRLSLLGLMLVGRRYWFLGM